MHQVDDTQKVTSLCTWKNKKVFLNHLNVMEFGFNILVKNLFHLELESRLATLKSKKQE